jgi:hypothetical protein
VLLGFNQVTGHPSAPWNQTSHRPPQCSLESTKSLATLVLLGFNQATRHPSAPLDSSKPPVHPGAPLDSSKPPIHPSAPLDCPSHWFTPVLPWYHPSHWSTPVGVILLHCTRLQYSLHLELYLYTSHAKYGQCIHPTSIQTPF